MTTRLQDILFVCSRNAGRSQIAAAFCNKLASPDRVRASSAGLDPAPQVHPDVVVAMQEVGIDLSQVRPLELTARMQTEVSFLVTMGCAERCPLIPAGRRADWKLDDPEGQPLVKVREIRDQIRGLVQGLVIERGWA